MNILPTGPDHGGDPKWDRYFRDLRRWNYDIAYNAFYAFPLADVTGKYRDAYIEFAARARREGVPVCVQIQSTVAHLSDIPLTETQRYHDGQWYQYEHFAGQGRVFHFASFASRAWLDHLKRLTTLFREYGYEWVVYEEPMQHSDIPGPGDPYRALFAERFPDLEYPTHQEESRGYLALQQLKRDQLVGFFAELCHHAKSAGYRKAGIMPWFFTPTLENTPRETWNTCCDTGRLMFLDDVDFLVARMQPDNIHAQVMAGAAGESGPTLAYYECMAHAAGKPVIMVNNPMDEHLPEQNRESPMIPLRFFQRYTLAAAAACPQGMSRHWYPRDGDPEPEHMEFLAGVNDLLRRLGPPACGVAFVFSHAGASHVWPRPWREAWRTWWNFAVAMTEEQGVPFLTFFAESLPASMAAHPEVRVVVLSEHFPIPPHEVEFLERWLAGDPRRRVVYFGGRSGTRWTTDDLFQEFRLRPPEMAALCGVDTSLAVRIVFPDSRFDSRFVATAEHDAVLGEAVSIGSTSICVPAMKDQDGGTVVYGVPGEEGIPLAWKRTVAGAGEAWFVGVALEGRPFRFPFRRFFERILEDGRCGKSGTFPGWTTSPGVFANITRDGFLVASNTSQQSGTVTLAGETDLWDVTGRELSTGLTEIVLSPTSIRVFRLLGPGRKILDIRGAIIMERLDEMDGAATIRGLFHREVEIALNSEPLEVWIDGNRVESGAVSRTQSAYLIRIIGLPLVELEIEVRWAGATG